MVLLSSIRMKNINELCLFIGGASDGKRIAIPVDQWTVKVPVPNARDAQTYRGELLAGEPDTQIRVFVLEGVTVGEALRRLVDHYRQNMKRSQPGT